MNYDLRQIKKKYGEDMMHFCRNSFSTILEKEGALFEIFEKHFYKNKFLYKDLEKNHLLKIFNNYIYSIIQDKKEEIKYQDKNPKELMSTVGYKLYECKTEEDILQFKKYYYEEEELCTFNGGRLEYCYIFFAVKNNVDEIKRENFIEPIRQDEYGTSVISIQFTRGKYNAISIKNRYNHTVSNPDATFSNNLNNIVDGLADSFRQYYNLNFVSDDYTMEIPGYVRGADKKYYKYNYEINNINYCPNNIVLQNYFPLMYMAGDSNSEYILMDYFILNLKEKKVTLRDETIEDSFINFFKKIKIIDIYKNNEDKTKSLYIEREDGKYCFISLDKFNRIIEYRNDFITDIGKNFLRYNTSLEYLNLPSVRTIGSYSLEHNLDLIDLYLPNVRYIGHYFM